MKTKEINLAEFIKNYLSILNVPANKLDENAGKIFYTVLLSVLKEKFVSEDQAKILEQAVLLLRDKKNQEGFEAMKTVFEGDNPKMLQSVFVEKLIKYLLNMTNKIASSLTENQKQKLDLLLASV